MKTGNLNIGGNLSGDDYERIIYNIVHNAFNIAINGSRSVLNMKDQIVDEYEDETGIDTENSTNESYDSTNDLYSPTGTGLDLGRCGVFNGSTAYLTAPDHADFDLAGSNTDYWTIDFWIKFDTHNTNEPLICQAEDADNQWIIQHAHGSGFRFLVYSSGALINTGYGGEITDTDWHHVALIKVADEYAIYVDGTQVNYVQDNSTDTYTGPLMIGSATGYGSLFDGNMDEIRIVSDTVNGNGNPFSASPNVGLTDTISVPTGAHSSNSYTHLLLHLEDNITDSGNTVHTITNNNMAYTDGQSPVINNMTLISNSQTAQVTPLEGRIVIFEEDVDAITINTDLKAYISRDGGTTWTQITLADEGDYDTNKRVLTGSVDVSGQPSGTSMKYKITTHNNKDLKIHGTGMLWRE